MPSYKIMFLFNLYRLFVHMSVYPFHKYFSQFKKTSHILSTLDLTIKHLYYIIFNNTIVFVYIITKMASLHMQHAHLQKTATFDVICLTIYTSPPPPPPQPHGDVFTSIISNNMSKYATLFFIY